MASRGRGHKGRLRVTGQAPSAFDQQAFVEAVGIAVVAIAQACAMVNQGRSNDLQRIETHHSPLGREGGVDDIRGTHDICVGSKRKEDPSSSNLGKRQKTSASHEFQDQGQDWVSSQAGQMLCYFCRQPGHFRLDCPQRRESQSYGTPQSQSSVKQVRVAS